MTIREKIVAAVEEYVSAPEAWDDAQLTVDPATERVDLVEEEEAESLPDEVDVYDIMDLVEMTPDGAWIPDGDSIDEAAENYK